MYAWWFIKEAFQLCDLAYLCMFYPTAAQKTLVGKSRYGILTIEKGNAFFSSCNSFSNSLCFTIMSELRNEALSFDAFIPILHLYMKRNKLVTKGAGLDPIGVLIALGMPHWTVNIKRKNTDAVKTAHTYICMILYIYIMYIYMYICIYIQIHIYHTYIIYINGINI